jgi:pimeloyl-ACP methyl ester carboxylesterase
MHTHTTPRIAFDDVGDGGPALLLMPGWGGPRTLYRTTLPALARARRVLALDWRGHGGSAAGPDDFGYGELVADAMHVLDTAGVDRVIPVGCSHAGWAAIDLRRQLGPERVPGVIFVDWMVLGAPPPFVDALAGLQHPERWREVRSRLFEMWTTGIDLPALHAYIAEMAQADRTMWARAAREIGARFAAEPVPLEVLAREPVPCPALHVYAQPADPALLAAQRAYAASHPWFSVHQLAAKSHFPMLEVPDALTERIEQFASALR